MEQLSQVIKQLSDEEYLNFYRLLKDQKAEKSAEYIKLVREQKASDAHLKELLQVNKSAFYTLKSRLQKKIESFLVTQLKDYKIDLLRKAINNPELLYDNSRDICIVTLKKIEKDLIHYDLPYELITVYKSLKKMYINTPDFYSYSKLYNKHIAYTLALDKAEDLFGEFFKTYGNYLLSRSKSEKEQFGLFKNEFENLCNLYESHRLNVYKGIIDVFYNLFIDVRTGENADIEDSEALLKNIREILKKYPSDPVYQHIERLLDFLTFCYFHQLKLNKRATEYFEKVDDDIVKFLTYFNLNFFTPLFLNIKMERYQRFELEDKLFEENKEVIANINLSVNNVAGYVIYTNYMALSCYYAGEYNEALNYIKRLRSRINIKKYMLADIDMKLFTALLYALINEQQQCAQILDSTKRQIRIFKKEDVKNIRVFAKIVASTYKRDIYINPELKIRNYVKEFEQCNKNEFKVLEHLKLDEKFIHKIFSASKIRV